MGSRRARQYYCRCGTHLAKDNTERQCARCQRASRDKLITPPQVPLEFWETEQFREAFAVRHMGWVTRAYRTHPYHRTVYGPSGISQTLLGQWLGLRQPQVSRFETGPPIQHLDTLQHRAGVLRIPVELLWFDMPGEKRQRAVAEPTGNHLAATTSDSVHPLAELSGEKLKRRNAILGVALTTAVFAEPALLALTAPPVVDVARDAGSRRIGMTDVEILTENIAHLRRMDFRYGSGRIREQAVQLLHNEATTLLRGSYWDATGRALLTAVAQAARLAASMAADVGRYALAQRYYIQALNLARNAGNRLFAATILSDMSRLTIQNATGKRCAHQAVALARAGTMVAGKATPTLAAQLSAVEARGHALCRDTNASRTAVLEAERHYERFRADNEPPWLSFYTEAELSADLGRALRDSGESARATQLMIRTLDSYESWRVRSRCFVQTDLATAYLIEGDHEHVAVLIRDALSTAGEVSSDRTVSRIQALQQQIRPLRSAGLAILDEEITDFLRRAHNDEDMTI